ncbi:MAG TPA: hypothetical protein VH988_25760 [Thermoanaerobaculia bacterium]|nr:hypothetical protein [Thermoanaerobaculia bacterium]
MVKACICSLVLTLALPAGVVAQPAPGSGEEASFAGTTGFITTRPTCVPPGYTADALNYLQGPEPIQLANGDVTLLVGTGHCCGRRHWEGLFALSYPAAGRSATPRFRGLWATNDFSRLPSRKEAELGFPSALFYGGKWRIALTTTFLPFHRPDRDRVGRLDLVDLVARATPSQVTNAWVKPLDPACRGIASCSGAGSGLDAVLTLHPNGDLYLYHRDGNYPACPSGYVRHRVAADFSVSPSQDDGCIRFEGLTAAPFLISDIARTQDGRMVLLTQSTSGRNSIVEWGSEGGADEIGLNWKPTGRSWPRPDHPKGPPWGYYVRDAAFLKDATRTVIEPNVVVAQISDGTTYADLVNVQLGRWYLYYWAAEGAVLPPTFGGPANACAFQGALERAACTGVSGWAWDPMFPSSPVSVDVLVDGVFQQTIPADLFRQDLVTAGRGDGRHGFVWPIPAALKDGRQHRITVRFSGSDATDLLPGKRPTINCR